MGAASILKSNSSDTLAELQNLTDGSIVAVVDTFGVTDTGHLQSRYMSKEDSILLSVRQVVILRCRRSGYLKKP